MTDAITTGEDQPLVTPSLNTSTMTASGRLAEAEVLLSSIGPLVKKQYMVNIQGTNYLQVAGAASLGWALGYTTRLASCERKVTPDGLGHWEAVAEVIDTTTGEVVGRGHGHVFDDEKPWGSRPQHARAAMCQTRAQGRALKGVVGWLFGMLGAEVSLYEEMPPEAFSERSRPAAPVKRVEATPRKKAAKKKAATEVVAAAPQAPSQPVQPADDPEPILTASVVEDGSTAVWETVGTKGDTIQHVIMSFVDQHEKKDKDKTPYWRCKSKSDVKYVCWDGDVGPILLAGKGGELTIHVNESKNPQYPDGTIVGVEAKVASGPAPAPALTDDDIPF